MTWDVKGDFKRPVSVRVVTDDRPGCSRRDLPDLQRGRGEHRPGQLRAGAERAVNTFEVSVPDLKQLTDVMRSLEKVEGVHSVERV